ncbi:hypothetical protein [Paractinoplanes rishiriensis]|uniref:Uncharacterized protein n=1 Tax=Paractinoplanes rishiriensis TaxID=1050105 RepID=A0A919JZR3_9ACTN|nr:hypothetical protein [Actinoplanes rishiriensis]GIE96063.1 hypothetical protein Ari01nite_35280 [Actinoplanes rishiriensis]
MNPDLEVDMDELGRAASALAATADRIAAGSAPAPAVPTTPRWHAVDATALACAAARQQLACLGADVGETARLIEAAAAAYEVADARAATRFRLTR